jgi:hypothetical protein
MKQVSPDLVPAMGYRGMEVTDGRGGEQDTWATGRLLQRLRELAVGGG